jgi:erythromycin esterase-like protein
MTGLSATDRALCENIRQAATPLIGTHGDLDPLIDEIGDAPIVLLGEATHGTHEFYSLRFEITKRLIEEKNFAAVALEADWPDALTVNRFIHDPDPDADPMLALGAFQRFPMWMWRNTVFLEMILWLRSHNQKESTGVRTSVYGLDLYSLYKSMGEVISYLDQADPAAARRARELYACFDHNEEEPVQYGRSVRIGAQPSCEKAAIEVAVELFRQGLGELTRDDEHFFARQNAELVKSAESYYRNLFSPLVNTWNVRDRHMADTVDNILEHLKEQGRPEKIVIWAHNSHIGDDRATEMGRHGQWSIGQLLRERHPDETYHLGFTTFAGAVMAASQWDHPPRLKAVRPARDDSFEYLLHQTGIGDFFLSLHEPTIEDPLADERLERAIGVIYAPETERASHYFHARLAEQFDSLIHIDRSSEIEPLDPPRQRELGHPSEVQL